MCSHCMQHISKWATSGMLLPYRRYSLVGEICEYLNIPLLDRCEYLGLRCDIGGWNRIRMDFGRNCHKPLKTFPPWGAGVKNFPLTHPCVPGTWSFGRHTYSQSMHYLDWESKGCLRLPKRINFRKHSKQPLTLTPPHPWMIR